MINFASSFSSQKWQNKRVPYPVLSFAILYNILLSRQKDFMVEKNQFVIVLVGVQVSRNNTSWGDRDGGGGGGCQTRSMIYRLMSTVYVCYCSDLRNRQTCHITCRQRGTFTDGRHRRHSIIDHLINPSTSRVLLYCNAKHRKNSRQHNTTRVTPTQSKTQLTRRKHTRLAPSKTSTW